MLAAIVLSKGCAIPCKIRPEESSKRLTEVMYMLDKGAVLAVSEKLYAIFRKNNSQTSVHDRAINALLDHAYDNGKLWLKKDIPLFVTEGTDLAPFLGIKVALIQPFEVEHGNSVQWLKYLTVERFYVGDFKVKVGKLSSFQSQDGVRFDPMSTIQIPKGEPMDTVRELLAPPLDWSRRIVIHDAYAIWNHHVKKPDKGLKSGLSTFLDSLVEARELSGKNLDRLTIISTGRHPNTRRNIEQEMTDEIRALVNDYELHNIVDEIRLGFLSKKMGDRFVVFENSGGCLPYKIEHSGLDHLSRNRRRDLVINEFKIIGPVPRDEWRPCEEIVNDMEFIQIDSHETS